MTEPEDAARHTGEGRRSSGWVAEAIAREKARRRRARRLSVFAAVLAWALLIFLLLAEVLRAGQHRL